MTPRSLEISAVARRILTEHARTRRSLIFWVVFPTLMLLLFGLIYAGGGDLGASFDRTAPEILIGAAMFFSCLGGPIAVIVSEREYRTLRRLLISPLRPSSFFLGVVAACLVIALGQAVIVYGIAALFGGRFHGSVVLGVFIVALGVFSYVGMAFFFGARYTKRTEDVNGPVAAFGVPLLVLAGTFFSTDILPSYLFALAQFDPIYHMNEALDGVSAEGLGVADMPLELGLLCVFAMISLLIGAGSFRTMLRTEKEARS